MQPEDQTVLQRARSIDDARQAAGQYVERDADGRDEEDRGERNLNEMRDIEGGVEEIHGKNQNAPAGAKTGRGAE